MAPQESFNSCGGAAQRGGAGTERKSKRSAVTTATTAGACLQDVVHWRLRLHSKRVSASIEATIGTFTVATGH